MDLAVFCMGVLAGMLFLGVLFALFSLPEVLAADEVCRRFLAVQAFRTPSCLVAPEHPDFQRARALEDAVLRWKLKSGWQE